MYTFKNVEIVGELLWHRPRRLQKAVSEDQLALFVAPHPQCVSYHRHCRIHCLLLRQLRCSNRPWSNSRTHADDSADGDRQEQTRELPGMPYGPDGFEIPQGRLPKHTMPGTKAPIVAREEGCVHMEGSGRSPVDEGWGR